LAEAKYAKDNYFDIYIDNKTRSDAVALARAHFQRSFRDRLGIKYFVPDPKNGVKQLYQSLFSGSCHFLKV
jgi:hypothetical protein